MSEIQTLLQEILKELKEIKAKMPLYSYPIYNPLDNLKKDDCGCEPYKVCMNIHCPRQIRLT